MGEEPLSDADGSPPRLLGAVDELKTSSGTAPVGQRAWRCAVCGRHIPPPAETALPYVSPPLLHGQAGLAGSVRRVPAVEIEALIARAVREHLGDTASRGDRDLISSHVARVEVQLDQLTVELKAPKRGRPADSDEQEAERTVLLVPWRKTPSKRQREIIVPKTTAPQNARPFVLRPAPNLSRQSPAVDAGSMNP